MRVFIWALVVLQLGLVTYDLVNLITHMATKFTLCCLRWRSLFGEHRNYFIAQVVGPLCFLHAVCRP